MYLKNFATILWCVSVVYGCDSDETKVDTTDLSTLNFLENYTLTDSKYGTETTVTVAEGKRVIVTNSLPNHETGDFPNSGNPNTISAQNITYTLPSNPTSSGSIKWSREPGIAVNGVKFEPETAERFVCTDNNKTYKIEAFQDLVDLGLDFNNAHVQPTGAYHYHGVPTKLIEALDKGEDLILVGFAKDGYPMYYSKSGKYKPSYKLSESLRTGSMCSYNSPSGSLEQDLEGTTPDGTFVSDWVYVEGSGDLDECNGMELNGSYVYFITEEYPYVSRYLKGEFTESLPMPRSHHLHRPPPPHVNGHSHEGGRLHRHD